MQPVAIQALFVGGPSGGQNRLKQSGVKSSLELGGAVGSYFLTASGPKEGDTDNRTGVHYQSEEI